MLGTLEVGPSAPLNALEVLRTKNVQFEILFNKSNSYHAVGKTSASLSQL